MAVKIIVGDAIEELRKLPAESVHCVVTSPPYWGLRSYGGDPGMIGLEHTFEEHLETLVAVFGEVRRVLRKDGTAWLNYGDAYAASGKTTTAVRLNKGAIGTDMHPTGWRDMGLKPKGLMMMPARVAMALQADGWWLRSEIVWHKPNPMPESVTDRPTSAHEKLFLLSKSGSTLFWTHRDGRWPGQRTEPEPDYVWRHRDTKEEHPYDPESWHAGDPKWRRANLWRGHDYFYDAEAVREEYSRPTESSGTRGDGKQAGHGRRHKGFNGRWDAKAASGELPTGANLRNVWKIATHSFSQAHFATFPPKLVEPCIKAGTSERGACPECGAPWTRVGVKGLDLSTADKRNYQSRDGDEGNSQGKNRMRDGHVCGGRNVFTTTGWRPTCEHDAEPVPCVVLDCFAGAGTVGLVADRLERDAVLIEISEEYAEMARVRIRDDAPLFAVVD